MRVLLTYPPTLKPLNLPLNLIYVVIYEYFIILYELISFSKNNPPLAKITATIDTSYPGSAYDYEITNFSSYSNHSCHIISVQMVPNCRIAHHSQMFLNLQDILNYEYHLTLWHQWTSHFFFIYLSVFITLLQVLTFLGHRLY